jgi:site-specific DNA-methyltransferase (adenine-specific)
MANIEFYNEDCIELMKRYPDNYFELAIVDPPYNVGASDGVFGGQKKKPSKISGKLNGKHYANHNKTPDKDYFFELFRVSKNQIIWGSNYYPQFLNHSGAIVWDKLTTGVLSDCEIAYQSFNKLVTKCVFPWSGFNKGNESEFHKIRVHPNQKPVALYKWLLKNYAKQGDKILDTHGGSMSSAIACYDMGFDLVITELDKEYFDKAKKRFDDHVSQLSLFTPQQLSL